MRVFCDDHEWVGDQGEYCSECEDIWNRARTTIIKEPLTDVRYLGNGRFSARLTGAIHHITINAVVSKEGE